MNLLNRPDADIYDVATKELDFARPYVLYPTKSKLHIFYLFLTHKIESIYRIEAIKYEHHQLPQSNIALFG